MNTPHRIGLLTPGWPGQNTPNGIATSVYFLAMGLHGIGATPVILANQIDGPCPPDIPVIPVPRLSWRWQDRLRARLGDRAAGHRQIARNIAAAVREAIRAHGLDVVIMEETNGWAGMVRTQVPIPVIVTLHGPWVLHKALQSRSTGKDDASRETRENRAFETAAGIIAPSRSVLEAVEKAVRLEMTPRILLPNAFEADPTTPLSASLPPEGILFVGRFDLHKGGDTVLAAFERLLETHPGARLTFAGVDKGLKQPDGSFVHMDDMLASLPEHVRTRLTYTGAVDREEVARLRASHAVALIASRYENLNYTLLEAMAAGQAIVCTAVGGPAEVLEHERTALLVPPADPEAMAAALARLIDDASLARQLGEAARTKLTQDFNPATVAAETVRFVETVLKTEPDR